MAMVVDENYKPPAPNRRRTLIICAILLAILLLVIIGLFVSVLIGKVLAANAMHALSPSLEAGEYKEAIKLKILSPDTARKLEELDRKFGRLKSIRWKLQTCQMSGHPCILRVDGARSGKSHAMLLYFYWRRCDGIDVVRMESGNTSPR